MSRIGKKPITIPKDVKVTLNERSVVVKGPKGELQTEVHRNISVAIENNEVIVTRPDDSKENKALHGLTRALIQNMVEGVTSAFQKTLVILGVGYRAVFK